MHLNAVLVVWQHHDARAPRHIQIPQLLSKEHLTLPRPLSLAMYGYLNSILFVPQARRQASNLSNVTEDFPATLTSMDSSSSEYAPDMKKPDSTSADSGGYTCTYRNCTLRFDTPQKLQKHKREGHRSSAAASDEGGMTSRNSQAGPHKCERINPSTGKACNVIFSRPYDLTRHEDTIHNARKQKVHCPICTEEKSFSRNDALTRHLRVVHPEHADLSKSRRRGARD